MVFSSLKLVVSKVVTSRVTGTTTGLRFQCWGRQFSCLVIVNQTDTRQFALIYNHFNLPGHNYTSLQAEFNGSFIPINMIGTSYDGIFKSMLYLTEILKGFHCQYVHFWNPTVYSRGIAFKSWITYFESMLGSLNRKIIEGVESEQDYSTSTVHIKWNLWGKLPSGVIHFPLLAFMHGVVLWVEHSVLGCYWVIC